MAITGIGNNYNNVYGSTYASQKNETSKKTETKTDTKETASVQANDTKKTGRDSVSDYYSYLQKNYDCVKDGKVAISGSYLKECANNPEKAKELEKNLSFFKESYERGLKNSQDSARAMGAKVVSYSENWSIDNTGNVTMIVSVTTTTDNGTKGWKELAKEREEKLKEKKEQERTEEKKKEQKEQDEERLEKIQISAQTAPVISDAYHKPVDIKA